MNDDERDEMLRDILAQTRETNGRVTKLENRALTVDGLLYGDSRTRSAGLIEKARRWDDTHEAVRNATQAMKRLAWAFVLFAIPALGKIAIETLSG